MAELTNSGRSLEDAQNLIVQFTYNRHDLVPLRDLEAKLQQALDRHKVGEGDGHSMAADLSDGSLFFVGPSAEKLFEVVAPVLREADFMADAVVRLYDGEPGDPDVTERQLPLRAERR